MKSKHKNSKESGSITIVILLVIPVIIGLVAFSTDVSNDFLQSSKSKLINDVSAIVGAARISEGDIESDASAVAKSTAVVNYTISRGTNVAVNNADSIGANIEWHGNRAVVTVTSNRPATRWFSGILGSSSMTQYTSESAAAVNTGAVDNSEPLHIVLVSDISSNSMCRNYMYYAGFLEDCQQDHGQAFSRALVSQLTDRDFLTWIPYHTWSKVKFNKLRMDAEGKALINGELDKLEYVGFVPDTLEDRNGPEVRSHPLYPYFDSLPEHASALAAARTVLKGHSQDIKEALVITTSGRNFDYNNTKAYVNDPNPDWTASWSAHLSRGEEFISVNPEEADSLIRDCDLKNVTSGDFWPENVKPDSFDYKPGAGEELANKIIRDMQQERDIRAYTVPLNKIDPKNLSDQHTYFNEAYAHNFMVNLADDPSFASSKLTSAFNCVTNRPRDKQGKYFPYSSNNEKRAKEMLFHARYSSDSNYSDSYYFKPTLISRKY